MNNLFPTVAAFITATTGAGFVSKPIKETNQMAEKYRDGFCVLAALVFVCGIESSVSAAEPTPIFSALEHPVHRAAPHGRGNAYAPDVTRVSGVLHLYYGVQGADGHDRICLATSRDGSTWTDEDVVFEVPGLNHVNDPSVVLVEGHWKMFYTRAEVGITDTIGLAESDNGRDWIDRGEVFGPGEPGSGNSLLVGRPSVLFENGKVRLWYDGRSNLPPDAPDKQATKNPISRRSVGYAESTDGITWKRHPRPVMNRDSGAVHVSRVDDSLVMLIESRRGTLWATSSNGIRWQHHGMLAAAGSLAPHGHVTPLLCKTGERYRLFYGAAMGTNWNENRLAWMDIDLPVPSPATDLEVAKTTPHTTMTKDPSGPKLPLLDRASADAALQESIVPSVEKQQRPNIVMVFTDDQRHDAVGYAGNPAITTPHLDALAKQGIVFRNCFVNTSICAISRARHEASVRDYYRSISGMDLGVGRIMDELRRRGLDQNTVVLFTSDNGHFSGEHGLGEKWLMYEPSLRVPGFFCDLRKPLQEAITNELVITSDFSATMLALAGLPIPDSMSGLDLNRLVDGENPGWREELFYDHPYAHGGKIPTTIGVRTRTHTYTHYTSETPPLEQLFDNQSDPDQLRNLATNPAFSDRLKALRTRCDQLQQQVQ